MSFSEGKCPAEVGKRDPLRRAAPTDFEIVLLDVVARLSEQPLSQVPQDFLDSPPQFLDRYFAKIGGARRGKSRPARRCGSARGPPRPIPPIPASVPRPPS